MSRRAYPIARVRLYEAEATTRVRYDGFGHYVAAAEILQDPRTIVAPIDPEALGLWEGPGYPALPPAALHVPVAGVNSVICRPFLDTTQGIGLGHFEAIGGDWKVLRGLGLGQEIKLYQADGRCNQTTGLRSRFELPRNPIFALSLYRAEPAPEHDWRQPPYTEIHFGITADEEWMILLPYGRSLEVLRRTPSGWRVLPSREAGVGLELSEGQPKGQRLMLWIAVLRQRLVLSTDGFQRRVWAYEDSAPVVVRQGKIAFWHNAGQWMISFLPVRMAPAVIHSPPIETGYPTRESQGELLIEGRMIPVMDEAGQILATPVIIDDTAERAGLSETERSWRVQINPFRYRQENVGVDPETGEPVHFETWLSPEWLSAQVVQTAELIVAETPRYEDLSADAIAIQGEDSAEKATAKYRVALDNQSGRYQALAEYRRASIGLGWRLTDGTEEWADVIDGHLVEPPLWIAAGGRSEARLNILDPMLRLRDEKADGRTPVFDGWPVRDVFHWVLARCGIPESEQDLEDTGTILSVGTVEEPAWQIEPGRSWLEFLRQVAEFDYGAAIYFDERGAFCKTCPHCRQKRTAEDVTRHDGTLTGACDCVVRWELFTRVAAAPSPEAPGEIIALERTRRSLTEEEYSNYVVVCGATAEGEPIRACVFDVASLYDPESERFVGWRKMEVTNMPGYTSADVVQRLAWERFAARSTKPEHVILMTPLLPGARVGHVIRIRGGETVGVQGGLYRIRRVRHHVRRRPHAIATTMIEARWIGQEEA